MRPKDDDPLRPTTAEAATSCSAFSRSDDSRSWAVPQQQANIAQCVCRYPRGPPIRRSVEGSVAPFAIERTAKTATMTESTQSKGLRTLRASAGWEWNAENSENPHCRKLPGDVMTSATKSLVEPAPQPLTWQLVHAESEALVYSLPGLKPTHPLVRHAGAREGGWAPSGIPAGHGAPDKRSALHYAEYIGRVGVLAAALGVGAAGAPGLASAEPTDTTTSTP